MSDTESPDFDRLAEGGQILRESNQQKAEIARLQAELAREKQRADREAAESDVQCEVRLEFEAECASLRAAARQDAETIARLQANLSLLGTQLVPGYDAAEERDELRAAIRDNADTIARLRATLSSIENHELRDHEDYTAIQDIARAALAWYGNPK